jgi:hypothetical protein
MVKIAAADRDTRYPGGWRGILGRCSVAVIVDGYGIAFPVGMSGGIGAEAIDVDSDCASSVMEKVVVVT